MEEKAKNFGKRLRRVMLVGLVLAMVYFFYCYGHYKVIPGMDTMPEYPPGTTCLIEKSPGNLQVGSVVLIQVGAQSVLLSRIAGVVDDLVTIRHDNRNSVFLAYEQQTYPRTAVRALILTGFVPDEVLGPQPRGAGDGK